MTNAPPIGLPGRSRSGLEELKPGRINVPAVIAARAIDAKKYDDIA